MNNLNHFRNLAALALALFFIQPAKADWQLVWSDEFSGGSINPKNWTFDIGTGPPYPGWGNNELEYYTSRTNNAYVAGGLLHIVAKRESYNGSSYTSAKLNTLRLFSQTYGRFEFRAKLPQGQGYWPALWMMPRDSVYGGWAASGEIDVMENNGNDPTTVLGTIHFGGQWPNQDQSYGPAFTFPTGDSVTNFHVYALEWTNNAISWYVDNQLYETQTYWWSSGGIYPAPFDQPFYIIMNLAVGGNFVGNPNGNTVFPGDMQVDYVRVYDWITAPPLTITPSGTNVILSWATNTASFTLEFATNLASPADWNTNSAIPIIIGGQNVVTNSISGSQQFFRLFSL
jgi:beta-glucanase (GH16 family)